MLKILEKLNQQKGSVVQRKNMIVQIFEDLLNKILSIYCQDICFRNWFDQSYDCIPWKVQVIISVCFCFTGDVMLTRIHHHVTGILSHGQGKAFKFTWTNKFPCDTNITMNCLLKVFEDLFWVIYFSYKIDHITITW